MAVFWYGGAFLVVPLVTSASSVDWYLVYLDGEPFVPLLLASYWCLVLKLQLGAFSIVGSSNWNALPLEIHLLILLPKNNESVFCRLIKTDLHRRGCAL